MDGSSTVGRLIGIDPHRSAQNYIIIVIIIIIIIGKFHYCGNLVNMSYFTGGQYFYGGLIFNIQEIVKDTGSRIYNLMVRAREF